MSEAAKDLEFVRGLLFGVLAYRIGAVDGTALTEALSEPPTEACPSLDKILLTRKRLDPSTHTLVEGLVGYLTERHGGDFVAALAALHVESGSAVDTAIATHLAAASQAGVGGGLESLWLSTEVHIPAPKSSLETSARMPVAIEAEEELLGGRYRLVRFLDRGSLGEVYVAHDTELDREVALKQIQERHLGSSSMRGRFDVEARVTGGLDHPGIAPVYSLGQDDRRRPFYTMRLIRGVCLRDAIETQSKSDSWDSTDPEAITLRGLVQRLTAACYAVAYAHSRAVVHRDLKPANIMLGDFGETMVVDWGLAKPLGRMAESDNSAEGPLVPSGSGGTDSTSPGGVKGTLAYMSPEQARGEEVTPASDTYSLGATLYSVLTGKAPFRGAKMEVLEAVRTGRFPKPRSLRPGVPAGLEAICLKAMALRPEQRFTSVRELAAELERWLNDEPLHCHREPWHDRGRRWARRHRVTVGMLVAGLIMLAIASFPLAYLIRQLGIALNEKEAARLDEEIAKNKAISTENQVRIAWGQDESHLLQLRRLMIEKVVPVAEGLAYVPGAASIRQELVTTAVGSYRRFLTERRNDRELKREATRVFRTAANVGRLLESNSDQTEALYSEAVKLIKGVFDTTGERQDARLLARVYLDRGAWYMNQGALGRAENDMNAAFDSLHPDGAPKGGGLDDRNDRQTEAMTWLSHAQVRARNGRADARNAAAQAVMLFASLSRQPDAYWIDGLLHVQALTSLATLERESGNGTKAEVALRDAKDQIERLLESDPQQNDLLEAKALMLLEFAQLPQASIQKRREMAIEAIVTFKRLFDSQEKIPDTRRQLGIAHLVLSEVSIESDAIDEAATSAERALALAAVGDPAGSELSHSDYELSGAARAMLARVARGRADFELAKRHFAAAVADYQRAISRAPENPQPHRVLKEIEREHAELE
jgi:serine/threonine protein kinase